MSNPYLDLVRRYVALMKEGLDFPLGGMSDCPRVVLDEDAPKVLFFAPHPDDECIMGGLALRLLRELKMRVINVAVTQGSNTARQAERWDELTGACRYLGFGLVKTAENGLENVNLKGREQEPERWAESVRIMAEILREHQPALVFFPHDEDWNSTHLGTRQLVVDAMAAQGEGFTCLVAETEIWRPMDDPNLVVESSVEDVADLMAATSFHVEEVKRNPYHLNQPAWMRDNVRRGAEVVGGQGGEAPDLRFATLYRLRRYRAGSLTPVYEGGRTVTATDDLSTLFDN